MSEGTYNVPMALDQSLIHTRGLEPERAKLRNTKMIEEAKNCTLGPIPVRHFVEEFLYAPSHDRKGMSSPRNAFRSVPSRAINEKDICEPLVRFRLCVYGSTLFLT